MTIFQQLINIFVQMVMSCFTCCPFLPDHIMLKEIFVSIYEYLQTVTVKTSDKSVRNMLLFLIKNFCLTYKNLLYILLFQGEKYEFLQNRQI